MTILRFTGEVVAPPESHCTMQCAESDSRLTVVLGLVEEEFAEVISGTIGVSGGVFVQLGVSAIASLQFLALSVGEGESFELVIGDPLVDDSLLIDGVYVASLGAGVAGADIWIKSTAATLQYVAAGA